MRDVTVDTFRWITSLRPDDAAANYFHVYFLDTHAAFQEGWDAGFDAAVNTTQSTVNTECLDCGSDNTVAWLTVRGN